MPSSRNNSCSASGNILILPVCQPVVALNHRHPAAKSAHGLPKLKTYITAPNHEQMLRNTVEFQRLDVRHGVWLRQAPEWSQIVAQDPVLMTTRFPRRMRTAPSLELTSMVFCFRKPAQSP